MIAPCVAPSAAFGNKKAERSARGAAARVLNVIRKPTCLDSILTPWNSRAIKRMLTQGVPGSFPLPAKEPGYEATPLVGLNSSYNA